MTSREPASGDGAPVRLALLDDHEILLDSLSSWIGENAPEFDLVLRATTWMELVLSPEFPTDLVIMDLQLAESVSIEARIRTCRAAGAKVIILSALDTRIDRDRALDAGASTFLSKAQPMVEVIAAARRVMGVGSDGFTPQAWRPPPPGSTTLVRPQLSKGELEALTLYADGSTTGEVAAMMGVRYETVKTYLRRVREKYGKAGRPTSSRADLIRRAAEDGYLV